MLVTYDGRVVNARSPEMDAMLMILPPPFSTMIRAAAWLQGKAPGLYDMRHVLGFA